MDKALIRKNKSPAKIVVHGGLSVDSEGNASLTTVSSGALKKVLKIIKTESLDQDHKSEMTRSNAHQKPETRNAKRTEVRHCQVPAGDQTSSKQGSAGIERQDLLRKQTH